MEIRLEFWDLGSDRPIYRFPFLHVGVGDH